jgi:hypothetical protein
VTDPSAYSPGANRDTHTNTRVYCAHRLFQSLLLSLPQSLRLRAERLCLFPLRVAPGRGKEKKRGRLGGGWSEKESHERRKNIEGVRNRENGNEKRIVKGAHEKRIVKGFFFFDDSNSHFKVCAEVSKVDARAA